MKVKVSESSGSVLDWMVAKCEGHSPVFNMESHGSIWHGWYESTPKPDPRYRRLQAYSTNWAQGGPIIERETIAISYDADWVYDPAKVDPEDEPDNGDRWYAEIRRSSHDFISDYGPTPLIAAMRAFVASKLGDEVEVPDELAQN